MNAAALRQSVLDQVLTGVLPREPARALVAAYGDGSCCTICGEPTPASGVTYSMRIGCGADARTAYVHCSCFDLWEEIRKLPLAGPSKEIP